ncbi:MAG TPA: Hsp20/alpha crystallin family protein [Vicinamibacteria bacterium]|nr:Hsp20/alpha crystallin family protein [Vicinamibacteria bacterium]
MTIRRSDPLADLLSLQEKMNRLFQESLSAEGLDPSELGPAWTPLADAHETPDTYVVELEVPGLQRDDLDVQVEGARLVVKGERRPATQGRPDRFYRMERSYGPFSRSFTFAEPVDADRVTAQLRDGILRLELPKARPRAARRGRGERVE